MKLPRTAFNNRTFATAVYGLSITIIIALLVLLVWITGRILGFLQPVIVPLAIAGIIAYLLDPVVSILETRKILGIQFTRLKAIIAVFAGLVIAFISFTLVVVPPLYQETNKLLKNREKIVSQVGSSMEEFLHKPAVSSILGVFDKQDDLEDAADELLQPDNPENDQQAPSPEPDEQTGETPAAEAESITQNDQSSPTPERSETQRLFRIIEGYSSEISSTIYSLGMSSGRQVISMLGYLIGLVMVPVYLFFFLKDSASIRANWHAYVPLKASKFKNELVTTLQEINGYLIAFFRGQVVVSLIDGILTGIMLKIVGLPYAIVIGLSLAVVGVIPFIGIIITFVPAALIAFVTGTYFTDPGWTSVLLIAAIFFVVQQFDGFVIQPKIVGDSTGLHPMTVIFSVFFWSLILGGFIGALLAVPLTAAVKVIFVRYLWDKNQLDSSNRAPV